MSSSDNLSMSAPFLVADGYVFVTDTTGGVTGDKLKVRHVDQLTVQCVSGGIV